jgi:hypothetical protein
VASHTLSGWTANALWIPFELASPDQDAYLRLEDLGSCSRAVDLGFPEFTRRVHTLESQLATTILSHYPTAASFRGISVKKLARIIHDGSHRIGEELARVLLEAAATSVGSHHSEPHRLRVK